MTNASQTVMDLYDRHADVWDTLRDQSLFERTWLEAFLSHLPRGAHILDLGCGHGVPIARYLIEQGCDVTGVDTSPRLLGKAQNALPNATWIQADMRRFKSGTEFDGILAWNSLFHLHASDQRSLFKLFRDATRPGGALMFTTGPGPGVSMGEFEGEPLYHASLELREYTDLLTTHGFSVTKQMIADPACKGATVWLAHRQP